MTRACDYYNVSADFLLGRTLTKDGSTIVSPDDLYDYSNEKDNVLHGSIVATLNKKLLVNSISVLFDLLGKTGCKGAIKGAADYLSTVIYTLFRYLFRADGTQNEDFFAIPAVEFTAGLTQTDLIYAQCAYVESSRAAPEGKGHLPRHEPRRTGGRTTRRLPVAPSGHPQHGRAHHRQRESPEDPLK